MEANKDPLQALPYSPQPPSAFRPADVVCHAVFAAGVGLSLGGWSGVFYGYSGIFMEWYPHLITLGGFMTALVVSFRLGPVFK